MSLTAGSKLFHYEVLGPLGAGAMGEVYRARDTKLGREVAIKVLPEHFAEDEERLARFEREARTLASLNHPHVAQIFSVDQVGDTCFLVLELVPGETLEERLKLGPLPVDEALEITRQIAEGLEAAHEAGVIHRDLKPANVRITPEGKVKVLDFGLAKPASDAQRGSSTDSVLSTEAGRLLGTPTYMAPEQARGKPIDKRVDVWAFGCVLYECLTARRAFAGESLTDVLGAVLHTSPDLAALPSTTPPRVRELLARCLEKDPRRRLRDVGEARLALDGPHEPSPAVPARRDARPAARELVAWALVVLVGGSALLAWSGARTRAPGDAGLAGYRFRVPLASSTAGRAVLSPDGRHLVSSDANHLWVRALDQAEGRRIEGTSGAQAPFWSPGGERIGYFRGPELLCIEVDGDSPPRVLAQVAEGTRSGTWSSDGTILVYHSTLDLETWLVLDPGATSLRELRKHERKLGVDPDGTTPSFLPDGRHFLFTRPIDGQGQLQVGSLDSDEVRVLAPAGTMGVYGSGHVLYVRDGVLYAQAFDADELAITGPPRQIVDDVQFFASNGSTEFSVSKDGTLAYRRSHPPARLVWVDRGGRELATLLEPDLYVGTPDLSPDGKRLAIPIADPRSGTGDLWLVDLERGVPSRLTSARRSEGTPCWSPDGARLAYTSDREGPPNVYEWDFSRSTGLVRVPYDRSVQNPSSWTPDGKSLVYTRSDAAGSDVFVADLAAGTQRALLDSSFSEFHARLSPDGRHVAFASDESGRAEVYVAALEGGHERTRVSVGGGIQPRWSADGRELTYELRGTALMRVAVEPGPEGGLRVGSPELLFRLAPDSLRGWDVHPDGQRILLILVDPADAVRSEEIVVGWPRLLLDPGP